ncbi:helix-turn-helix domain-containing protein [Actinotignum urinale]|uniref:helix-turn-helix domain-containing protein n=1 Tax=Actinotignum urinale TaxID=190146 RepID=UPI0003B2F8D3|nr:helix-turn-helix transcriptional regulator [Actinotignum urinale]MDY5159543.1 helix-turn-helix transcriptional regulator [Actinotignum urinale]
MSIASEVRAEIARKNITVQDLAEKTNLKRSYLSQRLNEHKEFYVDELMNVSRTLNVPAWELVRRAEENQQQK